MKTTRTCSFVSALDREQANTKVARLAMISFNAQHLYRYKLKLSNSIARNER